MVLYLIKNFLKGHIEHPNVHVSFFNFYQLAVLDACNAICMSY